MRLRQKGFTLIELMVVISITAVLGTLGIAGFNNYNKVQVLQNAANELITTLNTARSRAQSQVKLCLSSQVLEGYSIDISIPDSSYTLNSRCSGVSSQLSKKELPDKIAFKDTTAPTSFFFPIITGGVTEAGYITLSGYGMEKNIMVSPFGGISMQLTPTIFPTATPTPAPFPTSTPAPTPTPIIKRVFITSTASIGDLLTVGKSINPLVTTGLQGGDAICRARANTASLGGTWKAWLSDWSQSPSTRFDHTRDALPYKLVDRTTLIANNWTDLTDGTLGSPINKDENGSPATSILLPWTSTLPNGNVDTLNWNCVNWTNATSIESGFLGTSLSKDSNWTKFGGISCDRTYKLYCFEQ